MRRVLILAFLAFPLFGQTIESPPTSAVGRTIQTLVTESNMEELRWPDFTDYRKHLRNFYGPNGYRPAWVVSGSPTTQALMVIGLFEAADSKGINAVDYDAGRWVPRMAALTGDAAIARFDVAVTATLMRYISDLHIGRINPRNIRLDLDIETKKYYLPTLVDGISKAADPMTILNTIEPPYDDYRRLQAALVRYRAVMADSANEPPLPEVKKVAPGETWSGVPQLAEMLRRVGDLPKEAVVDGTTYSGAIVDAMKRFQIRHGLEPDGVLAAKTLAQLNVPASRRVKQIQWALERWRWAPIDLPRAPIVVNVPEFRLRAWDEKQKTALTMRVVVGKAYKHQTPVFVGDLRNVVFRPYWNVPPSIQRSEIAPKLDKDPGYLARNGYEIVDGSGASLGSAVDAERTRRIKSVDLQLRQKPGGSNALGLVKFLFPNSNNVYLHSTPAQSLFSRSRRDFSHGCIRLEDPVALAAWVLRDQPQWTPEKIREAMLSGRDNHYIVVRDAIPVLIFYSTAVVLENGEVHFFEDIYGHDATLENALAAGYPYPA
jgi:murein L,D-transpeptidase YcbB/YkuD